MDKITEKIFKVKETGYTIQGQTILENKDLIVHITGGNVPHLGVIVSYDCKKIKLMKSATIVTIIMTIRTFTWQSALSKTSRIVYQAAYVSRLASTSTASQRNKSVPPLP